MGLYSAIEYPSSYKAMETAIPEITIDPYMVLAIVAGLALAVERIIEAVKHIMDSQTPSSRLDVLEEAMKVVSDGIKDARDAVDSARKGLPINLQATESNCVQTDEPVVRQPLMQIEGIHILPTTPRNLDSARRLLFYQLFAAGLGILFAGLFNVHLFYAFFHEAFAPSVDQFFQQWPLVDEIMTGIIIGGGSQPVHLVIGYLTQRRRTLGAR